MGAGLDRPGFMGPDAATISAVISADASAVGALSGLLTVLLTWQGTRPQGTAQVLVTPSGGAAPVILAGESTPQSPEELSAQILEGEIPASGQ